MKISVIVPVYNSEKYLKKCINSVLKQSYSNWELILVDDGSIDSSGSIIDAASKEDKRIIAIHQKSAGPGEARNNGIIKATGQYVVFLDSDDYIDYQYLELLATKAKEYDLVFIDILQVNEKGNLICKEKMSVYKKWSKDQIIRSQMTGKIPWGGVRKAVRLSILKNENIRYTKHKIGEEALYSFRVLYAAKSIGFLDEKPVYYYVNHKGSQSKMNILDPWGEVVKAIEDYLKQNGLYKEFSNTLNSFNLAATVVSIDRISQIYSGRKARTMAKQRIRQYKVQLNKNAGFDIKNLVIKAKVFLLPLQLGIYFPIMWISRIKRRL